MIPQSYITAWRKHAPWQEDYQVEQDLIIHRSLVALFADKFIRERLAFRGGTALHKLFLTPSVRYSEDIDLVQVKAEPFGPIIDKIRDKNFIGDINGLLRPGIVYAVGEAYEQVRKEILEKL